MGQNLQLDHLQLKPEVHLAGKTLNMTAFVIVTTQFVNVMTGFI